MVSSLKVFEVNSSSQRSGRQILSQLKEATQSHQVDIQGVNAQKPSYFSNYSSNSTTVKPGNSPSMNVFFLGENSTIYTVHDFLLEFSVSFQLQGSWIPPEGLYHRPGSLLNPLEELHPEEQAWFQHLWPISLKQVEGPLAKKQTIKTRKHSLVINQNPVIKVTKIDIYSEPNLQVVFMLHVWDISTHFLFSSTC